MTSTIATISALLIVSIGLPEPTYQTRYLDQQLDTLGVTLIVGDLFIPINTNVRFMEQAAPVLPTPSIIYPGGSPFERRLASYEGKTFCYKFEGGYIQLSDSIFGMYTVTLTRTPPADTLNYNTLPAIPRVRVGSSALDLDTPPGEITPSRFLGFSYEETDTGFELKKAWNYNDPSRTHQWGERWYRQITIRVETTNGGISKLMISNWEEPNSIESKLPLQ